MVLQEKLTEIIPAWRERVARLLKEHGETQVDRVTISQVYGGMRNIKSLVTDISYVDTNEGIRLRGYTIPELLEALPKPAGGSMPLAGGLYYLLLVGEIPTFAQAMQVEAEWEARSIVPEYIYDILNSLPAGAYPMTMFSTAILALQGGSHFARRYEEGMRKEQYWEPMLEDSLDLLAKIPSIAAYIYKMRYGDGKRVDPLPDLDWSANLSHMMGIDQPSYYDLNRLYMLVHSDHESGNVSAHTTHLVASSLADIYYAASAAMNGLAGPLHGRASQDSLGWLLDVHRKYGGVPSKQQLYDFAWETLNAGQVIPGYGHAVLRKTDPRFSVLLDFGEKHLPEDEIFRLASLVYEVVPQVLKEQGKVKDPWPNVDAISGALQYHYGVRDCNGYGACGFLTVLFGVSRLLGVTAHAVWARALGQPIERPKSLTTAMLEEIAEGSVAGQPA